MKMSEQLEWEYSNKKTGDEESTFFTRDRISKIVAAELFIPIVEELYDNNIFTNWSGLERDAHIRIPLDGLSRENFLIAKRNCETSTRWRLQRPPYIENGQKDIIPNYSFEIYIDYEEGITEISDVIQQMLIEIRKLRYQDVQIAKVEYVKDSHLPRVDLEGLYKKSELEVFNTDTQRYEMLPAETFEELSEIFLEGDSPEYFYDAESDTYFRNQELIKKSKQYREYETTPEKRKERAIEEIRSRITEQMTDEEKYKVIFDWVVNNFDYAYSGLNYAYAEQAYREETDNRFTKYYINICRQNGINPVRLGLEERKRYLEIAQNNADMTQDAIKYSQKIVEFLENYEKCKLEEKGFNPNDIETVWLSKYGVCLNFACIYEFLCNKFELPCKYIQGTIDSGDYNVGHAWNAIMVNGKLRYVDISSAIHCKDGTNPKNHINDYFCKSYEELQRVDGGKNRKVNEYSQRDINDLINASEGWNFDDDN